MYLHTVSCGNHTIGLFPSQEMAIESIRLTNPNVNIVEQGEHHAYVWAGQALYTVVACRVSSRAERLH